LVILGELLLENAIEHLGQGVVGIGRGAIGHVPVEPLPRFLVGSGPAANPSADREAQNAAPEPKLVPFIRGQNRRLHRSSFRPAFVRVSVSFRVCLGNPRKTGKRHGRQKWKGREDNAERENGFF